MVRRLARAETPPACGSCPCSQVAMNRSSRSARSSQACVAASAVWSATSTQTWAGHMSSVVLHATHERRPLAERANYTSANCRCSESPRGLTTLPRSALDRRPIARIRLFHERRIAAENSSRRHRTRWQLSSKSAGRSSWRLSSGSWARPCGGRSSRTTCFRKRAPRRCGPCRRPSWATAIRSRGSARSPSGGSSTCTAGSSAPRSATPAARCRWAVPAAAAATATRSRRGLINLLVASMTTPSQAFSRNAREAWLLRGPATSCPTTSARPCGCGTSRTCRASKSPRSSARPTPRCG